MRAFFFYFKANKDFDIEDVVDDFVTFFIAGLKNDLFRLDSNLKKCSFFYLKGQETTANTLAFCFLEMGRNPRVLKR